MTTKTAKKRPSLAELQAWIRDLEVPARKPAPRKKS